MRSALILAGLILTAAAPGAADPVKISEGLWRLSNDTYTSAAFDGVPQSFDPDFETLEECWQGEHLVTIGDNFLFPAGFLCTAEERAAASHYVAARISCTIDGQALHGTSSFVKSSDGESFVLLRDLEADEPGFSMVIASVTMGRLLGACTAP